MTYLIQNNIAHFYSREDVAIIFPKSETIHISKHSISLLERENVKKVLDIPFKLNNVFIK